MSGPTCVLVEDLLRQQGDIPEAIPDRSEYRGTANLGPQTRRVAFGRGPNAEFRVGDLGALS